MSLMTLSEGRTRQGAATQARSYFKSGYLLEGYFCPTDTNVCPWSGSEYGPSEESELQPQKSPHIEDPAHVRICA